MEKVHKPDNPYYMEKLIAEKCINYNYNWLYICRERKRAFIAIYLGRAMLYEHTGMCSLRIGGGTEGSASGEGNETL